MKVPRRSPITSELEVTAEPAEQPVTATPPEAPTPAPDPEASVPAALAMLTRIYNDAGKVSRALTGHLRATVRINPEIHGKLHRAQCAIGDFRGTIGDLVVKAAE